MKTFTALNDQWDKCQENRNVLCKQRFEGSAKSTQSRQQNKHQSHLMSYLEGISLSHKVNTNVRTGSVSMQSVC